MISVGIDVSKGKSMVCIMKPGGEVLKTPFEMQHTMDEVLSLATLIKSYDEEVRVILESMIAGLNKFLRIYYGKITELYSSIEEQLNSDN